jgi:hypothetical protein
MLVVNGIASRLIFDMGIGGLLESVHLSLMKIFGSRIIRGYVLSFDIIFRKRDL